MNELDEPVNNLEKCTIRIEQSDRIAFFYLDKPPVNAIDLQLVLDAEEGLSHLETGGHTRAVVITGTGKCFSAGLDLKVVPHYSIEKQREMVEALNRIVSRLYAFPLPTVAAINGHAIAGGFILALSCDYRIGSNVSCRLGLTEARVGIPFPIATMEVLKAELAPAVARRITLVGRNMGPEDALKCGVLDELHPANQLLSRAKEIATDLGSMPPGGYARIKHQLRGETLARIDSAIKTGSDPLLHSWITGEARTASADHLEQDVA